MNKWFLPRLAAVFAQSIEAKYSAENEAVVGAAPTTTSDWSAILLPNEVSLLFEVWRYINTTFSIQTFL